MPWRHTLRGLDRLQLDMAFHSLGRKVSFGSGSNYSGWYQKVFQIFSVIIGVAALTTTLLLGSFLWGFVSRKSKKEREKSAPLTDLYPRASHKPNTVVALHEFTKPAPSLSPQPLGHVIDHDKNVFFDTLVFDAEHDYAQVLSEARSHASSQRAPITNSPIGNLALINTSRPPWLTRSSSARRHNPLVDDVEAVFPQHQDAESRSRKSWKKLLFWKRSKKSNQFEFDMNGAIHSSCSTPLHYMFKSTRTRATVAPSTPTNGSKRKPTPKRSNSGPLYSDGSQYVPTRSGRPHSGPLSASSTPSRDGLYESPYMPLKRPGSSPRISPGPVYVT